MGAFVGIDLGTTFSAVARVDEYGRPIVIPNRAGQAITPSCIYFGESPPLIGAEAKEMARLGEQDVAAFFKREMGNDEFFLTFDDKPYSAEALSALLLAGLKEEAEAVLGEATDRAVITVPAYFRNADRESTLRAGERAGFDVLGIINEPTAAALAFGASQAEGFGRVLVYDLGGGTFDVTLMSISPDEISVIATDGDHHLGGKDWDDVIFSALVSEFLGQYGSDPSDDPEAVYDILALAEKAKRDLSVRKSVTVTVHYGGERMRYELDRDGFEQQTEGLLAQTEYLTQKVLGEADAKWKEVDGVVLVGGSTRMPAVERLVTKLSGTPPIRGVNVDEAVALGAAMHAAQLAAEKAPEGGARLRLAAGAKRIRDVMSHSLGMIAVSKDRERYVNSTIVRKNRPIPTAESKEFEIGTRTEGPNEMDVYVTQGEGEDPHECAFLGKYVFSDIPHHASGKALLDVTYAYDRNGVVQVSARERQSGTAVRVTVEPLPEDMSWLDEPPGEGGGRTATVYLSIDLSGSMEDEPIIKAKEAAHSFAGQCADNNVAVGLISFADRIRVVAEATRDVDSVRSGIDSWTVGEVGYGNAAHPFAAAREHFAAPGCREGARFVVVLTDGVWYDQETALKEASQCHAAGIQIIAVGFGTADREFLKRIATCDEEGFLTDLSGLEGTLGRIARVVAERGSSLRARG